jgi:hypothetical protein
VPAFDFAVGLGIVRRGFDMGQTDQAHELLEVLGDELGADYLYLGPVLEWRRPMNTGCRDKKNRA